MPPPHPTGPIMRPGCPSAFTMAAIALTFVIGTPTSPPPVASFAATPPFPDDRASGADAMREPVTAALLTEYFEGYLRTQDIEAFRVAVEARYSEGTLARLAESGPTRARRAAVLALGIVGGYGSNTAVAERLKDDDPVVRELAIDALWGIWFRAGTPAQNEALERVRGLVLRDRPSQAVEAATRLIAEAPEFAEAYNQRAIARFQLGRFEESADDCRRTLERNPYHIGALGGLAQCMLQLDRPGEALSAYRRLGVLQPFDEAVLRTIAALEAIED